MFNLSSALFEIVFFLLKVHIRIASPPLLYPCYMGINIPTREELIANKLDTLGLAEHTGEFSEEFYWLQFLIEGSPKKSFPFFLCKIIVTQAKIAWF